MRYVALALALLCAGAAPLPRDATPPPDRLRVMTFNVRVPLASDGADAWPQRRARLIRTLARADADVIGTQELHAGQAADIVAALPRYAWFGRDRRGGRDDEHMGIFYRRDRLRLLRSGDAWLSDTPTTPGSISWGNLYPRMVSWGAFETRGARRFHLFNTHLPHRPEDEAARIKAAHAVTALIAGTAGDEPAVLTGDFNTTPDAGTHRLIGASLDDAWTAATARTGPAATYHGFTGRADRRIDWIFTRGMAVHGVRTVTTRVGGRYPSDHFPVVADLTIGTAAR